MFAGVYRDFKSPSHTAVMTIASLFLTKSSLKLYSLGPIKSIQIKTLSCTSKIVEGTDLLSAGLAAFCQQNSCKMHSTIIILNYFYGFNKNPSVFISFIITAQYWIFALHFYCVIGSYWVEYSFRSFTIYRTNSIGAVPILATLSSTNTRSLLNQVCNPALNLKKTNFFHVQAQL